MRYRNRSPYWLQARYASKCKCGKAIAPGDTVYYYPNGTPISPTDAIYSSRQVVCEACGLKGASDMADELAYAHEGNPY